MCDLPSRTHEGVKGKVCCKSVVLGAACSRLWWESPGLWCAGSDTPVALLIQAAPCSLFKVAQLVSVLLSPGKNGTSWACSLPPSLGQPFENSTGSASPLWGHPSVIEAWAGRAKPIHVLSNRWHGA